MKQHEKSLFRFMATYLPDLRPFLLTIDNALVDEMQDGGMGSLKFHHGGEKRKYGRQVGAVEVLDMDGMPVSVSVNLDLDGDLYEIDVFKADGSPTIRLTLELRGSTEN